MPSTLPTSTLVTPLASIAQIEQSASRLDGVSADLEDSIRFEACRLTQAAGALLHLPQDIIAQAIVTFTRLFTGPEGLSFRELGAEDVAAACLFLITKVSALPKTPRSIINVFSYLAAHRAEYPEASEMVQSEDAEAYYVSEATFQAKRAALVDNEALVLRKLGFQMHVALPQSLCVSYLQALEAFQSGHGTVVAKRAFAHMNTLLLSPQLIYLTHTPSAIATAAIYLAAREVGVKLPEEEWWEVFDTDREELGFLVVAMTSMPRFAAAEKLKWNDGGVPFSVGAVEEQLQTDGIQPEDVMSEVRVFEFEASRNER